MSFFLSTSLFDFFVLHGLSLFRLPSLAIGIAHQCNNYDHITHAVVVAVLYSSLTTSNPAINSGLVGQDLAQVDLIPFSISSIRSVLLLYLCG